MLCFVLLIVLPPLGVILYSAWEQQRADIEKVEEDALRLARIASAEQARLIEGTRQLLASLAQLPEVREHNGPSCSDILQSILKERPLYANLGAIRADGELFCSALPFSGKVQLGDRAYFQRALKTRRFAVGDHQIGRVTKKATINFGYPVFKNGEKPRAVVFAALDLGWLNQMAAQAKLPEGSTFTVVDAQGTALVHYPNPEAWIGKSLASTSFVAETLALKTGTAHAPGFDGQARLYGFTPLLGTPEAGDLYVSVGIPRATVSAKIRTVLARNLTGLGGLALLVIALAWVGSDLFVVRDVNNLVRSTERLASGDLRARAGPPYPKGELGQLALSFDRMAQSLEQRTLELEKSNRIKEEFLSVMSHELRTPLNVVMGYTGLMMDGLLGEVSPQQKEALSKIMGRAREQLSMVDSTLNAAALESGTARIQIHETDLRDLLESLKSDYEVLPGKEITLSWLYPAEPTLILTDSEKLKQILRNLTDNAIKFTDRGTVTISARLLPDAKAAEFKVEDTGIGIAREHLPLIFDKFRQVDSSETRLYGGVGMGLYITKKLTELLGGRIDVESEPGRGSTFKVTIPATRA